MTTPKPPTLGTLRSYGLTEADWVRLCEACGNACVICGQPFGNRPLVVDHEHVKGFRATKKIKAKKKRKGAKERHTIRIRVMSQEERRKYVRGVVHNYCNRFVRRWLTLPRAEAIVKYLRAFEETRSKVKSDD